MIEIEELLLSPEESESLLLTLFIIYIIMAIIGIIAWLLITRFKNRKIHTQGQCFIFEHVGTNNMLVGNHQFKLSIFFNMNISYL